jgi:hypothetical protein
MAFATRATKYLGMNLAPAAMLWSLINSISACRQGLGAECLVLQSCCQTAAVAGLAWWGAAQRNVTI